MGFLDSFLAVGQSMSREKYNNMSLSELESAWKQKFQNLPYSELNNIRSDSIWAALDEVYAYRTGKKSWRSMAIADQKKREQEKKEKERLEAAKQEFQNIIEKSEMARKILQSCNECKYDAAIIYIDSDEVVINNEYSQKILSIRYKSYGYPNLETYQVKILTEFLLNNLNLNYKKIEYNELELDDAPGGMKSSW